jgi:YspA, cpYpsA-related SLOG family
LHRNATRTVAPDVRVLVCGGRGFHDAALMNRTLEAYPITVLIQGEADGADRMAATWAASRRIQVERYPADWRRHGKAAGPIRNQQMLDIGRPDLVIAFPGGHGTADMVRRAIQAGIEVRRP